MNFSMIIPMLAGIAILFIILKILALPMKIIIKLVINGVIGAVLIYVINLIGAGLGFTITLTWITALIVGILGVPGVIIVAILQFLV